MNALVKKVLFGFSLSFAALASYGQEIAEKIGKVIPENFVCREFFSKNPMWINSGLYIEDLELFKGKILHTRSVSYELKDDGLKYYGENRGYPVDDTYIVFDEDGVIRYSCKAVIYAESSFERKTFSCTEYKFENQYYYVIEHSGRAANPDYVQDFELLEESDLSVAFVRGEGKEQTVTYRFKNESFFMYEDCRFAGESKKTAFTNEYIQEKKNRNISNSRVELKDSPLGFLEYYYSHPENGGAGRYSERKAEIIAEPDQILKENFPNIF